MSVRKKKGGNGEDQQPNLVADITFHRDHAGGVNVHGNITNPIATLEIIGKGLIGLSNYYANMVNQKSNIVLPNSMVISKFKK